MTQIIKTQAAMAGRSHLVKPTKAKTISTLRTIPVESIVALQTADQQIINILATFTKYT